MQTTHPELESGALPATDDAAFAAAAQRLGRVLPPDYVLIARWPQRKLLGWREPADLAQADATHAQMLDDLTEKGTQPLFAIDAEANTHELSRAQLARMLVLAGSDEQNVLLFDEAADPCCRVLELGDEESSVWPDLHAWLVARHTQELSWADAARRLDAAQKAVLERDAALDLPTLVERLRLCCTQMWPDVDADPRTPAQLDAATQRLGELPVDYRVLLALGNGLPGANLSPLDEVAALNAEAQSRLLQQTPWPRIADDGNEQGESTAAQAAPGALVIGAGRWARKADAASRATLLLVRLADGTPLYLDRVNHRAHESLRRLLLEAHAQRAAALDAY